MRRKRPAIGGDAHIAHGTVYVPAGGGSGPHGLGPYAFGLDG